MPTGEYRTVNVSFTFEGEGTMELTYIPGDETPEGKFREVVEVMGRWEFIRKHGLSAAVKFLGPSFLVPPQDGPEEPGYCPQCEGTGLEVAGDREVTCTPCGGTGLAPVPGLREPSEDEREPEELR